MGKSEETARKGRIAEAKASNFSRRGSTMVVEAFGGQEKHSVPFAFPSKESQRWRSMHF